MASKFKEVDTFTPELVTALGVLTIRAGHLDDYLGFFLSAVTGISPSITRALIYSTQSQKARSDMIRAAIKLAKFSEARGEFALSLLDDIDKAQGKRNRLIHGLYLISTKGGDLTGERVIVEAKSATKNPWKSRPIRVGEVEQAAVDFETLTNRVWNFWCDVYAGHVPGPSRGTPE